MHALTIGSSLQEGKYIIKEVLGQGGFGISYLAEHTLLGTKVAIKEFFFKQFCDREEATSQVILGTQSAHDEVMRYQEKFLKEARIIARLNHPNIVKVHDIFKENNTAYYVMDYIEGETLFDLAKRRAPLPEAEALEYIRQAGDALAYLHEQHLNHLDVKPGNIMLRKADNKVILIDFGMSKQYDSVSGNQTSTTPVGISEGYAPLEQYKEGGVKEFSPETDIYALGATLYTLLTCFIPVSATEIVSEGWSPEYPSETRDAVKAAIAKAMEIRKSNRYHSVNDFLSDLGLEAKKTEDPVSSTANETSHESVQDTVQATSASVEENDEDTQIASDAKKSDEVQTVCKPAPKTVEVDKVNDTKEQPVSHKNMIHWDKEDPTKLDVVYHDSISFVYRGTLYGAILTIVFAFASLLISEFDVAWTILYALIPGLTLGALGIVGARGLIKRQSGSVFLCLVYAWICTVSNVLSFVFDIIVGEFPGIWVIGWIIFGIYMLVKLYSSDDVKLIYTEEYRTISKLQWGLAALSLGAEVLSLFMIFSLFF